MEGNSDAKKAVREKRKGGGMGGEGGADRGRGRRGGKRWAMEETAEGVVDPKEEGRGGEDVNVKQAVGREW